MARRSFTLLELLITIALLATLAALALPTVIRGLAERMFVSATEGACEQILMARAAAQMSGHALEIVYQPDAEQIMVRRVTTGDEPDAAGASAAGARGDLGSGAGKLSARTGPRDEAPGPDDASWPAGESWASQSLGDGLRLLDHAPGADIGENSFARAASFSPDEEPAKPDHAGGATQSVRLAVVLPDGSALLPRAVWIVDDDGRAAKLAINAWTGLPQVERLPNAVPREGQGRQDAEPASGMAPARGAT